MQAEGVPIRRTEAGIRSQRFVRRGLQILVAVFIGGEMLACGGSGEVAVAPGIATQPADRIARPDGSVTFSVSASGSAPLSYQWQSSADGVTFAPLASATASQLTVALVTADLHETRYRVVVSNGIGSVTSAPARLTVVHQLNSVAKVDGTGLVAVGPFGVILRSFDAGASWAAVPGASRSPYLAGVSFAGPTVGVVVAQDGSILRTTDGGLSWTETYRNSVVSLYAVAFLDANVAVAAGVSLFMGSNQSLILRSTDAGQSWGAVGDTPAFGGLCSSIAVVDHTTAVVTGCAAMARTTDAGASWSFVNLPAGAFVRAVAFADSRNGFATTSTADGLTASSFLQTTDGGNTWSSTGYTLDALALSFASPTLGLALARGSSGLWRTADAGQNWPWVGFSVSNPDNFSAIAFVSPDTGVAVGSRGAVARTTDGGVTWTIGSVVSRTGN